MLHLTFSFQHCVYGIKPHVHPLIEHKPKKYKILLNNKLLKNQTIYSGIEPGFFRGEVRTKY